MMLAARAHEVVDLRPFLDCDSSAFISYASRIRVPARFSWRGTAADGAALVVGGEGEHDHTTLKGQRLPVVSLRRVKRLHVVGHGDLGHYVDTIRIVDASGGGELRARLAITCGGNLTALFGERPLAEQMSVAFDRPTGIRTCLWHQTVELPAGVAAAAIILPDNPFVRLYALTLVEGDAR